MTSNNGVNDEKNHQEDHNWLRGLWSAKDKNNEHSFYEATADNYENAMAQIEWRAPQLSMKTLENYERTSGKIKAFKEPTRQFLKFCSSSFTIREKLNFQNAQV